MLFLVGLSLFSVAVVDFFAKICIFAQKSGPKKLYLTAVLRISDIVGVSRWG